jgi:hypothetical protein
MSAVPRPLRKVNAVIYGPSGAGKTTLACTAPGPRLWFNFDPSGLTVVDWDDSDNLLPNDPLTQEPITQFDVSEPQHWSLFDSLLSEMESAGKDLREVASTIIIDTGTYMAKLYDSYLLSTAGPVGRVHPKHMSRIDYAIHAAEVWTTLVRLCHLPTNIVITCHVTDKRWNSPSGESRLKELPNFGGQTVPQEAPAMFDLIAYLGLEDSEDEAGQRYLQVEESAERVAKIRLPVSRKIGPRLTTAQEMNLSWVFSLILQDQ